MAEIVFGGVSPRSLGDLLKGYGIMAIVGEHCPEALFWWDDAFHLVVKRPCDEGRDDKTAKAEIEEVLRQLLVGWGQEVAQALKPKRQKSCDKPLPCPDHPNAKHKGNKKTCPIVIDPRRDSPIKRPENHDLFAPEIARWARAIALPIPGLDNTEPHPLFPGHGQEGSSDYFLQIEKASETAKMATTDIRWALYGEASVPLRQVLESGYLFFPDSMKRYATGLAKWEREKDAPRSPWDFLPAVRGALLLRGSLRRLRWGRREYPAFPFVFEGSTVKRGGDEFFQNVEIHLPTWRGDRPRTLAEFEMQVRQFQARLSERGFPATAAEFRVAVVGRGVGASFDTFHRFVLEGRRPGQQRPMRQGIPRGATRVGGAGEASGKLRLMLAPLAETGWFDQFTTTDRLREARTRVEEAIHRAVDEPGLEAYRGVLEALWNLNRSIILPGALRRDLEEAGRKPRPLPPLPVRLWEEALQDGLENEHAYRLGRAIGSIHGVRPKGGSAGVGPVLEHMLPVQYDWKENAWTVPDKTRSRPLRWTGHDPLADFRALLWSRWLDSAELDCLPFAGARCARLEDIAALLRSEVDIREVHRLAGLFALLDWQQQDQDQDQKQDQKVLAYHAGPGDAAIVPPAYAVLRLWLELGIRPASEARPPRDGQVVRLLTIGEPEQVQRAAALALSRLRVDGLPWDGDPRPTGNAVARFDVKDVKMVAPIVAVAVMVPIAYEDKLALSRRLWVPISEKEVGEV